MHAQLFFAPEVLPVRPWPDDVRDNLGHDPRSTFVGEYWLGILGPSTRASRNQGPHMTVRQYPCWRLGSGLRACVLARSALAR